MSRVGQFLVARPTLEVGFFARSVVYIYEDGPNGTAGVALNKQSNLFLRDLALQLGVDYPAGINVIYRGGPVNENAIMLLHTDDFVSANTLHTGRGLDISSDDVMIRKLLDGNTPRGFRLLAGASVWAPGQLDREITRDQWLLADLPMRNIFDLDGDTQWEAALESVGQQFWHQYL